MGVRETLAAALAFLLALAGVVWLTFNVGELPAAVALVVLMVGTVVYFGYRLESDCERMERAGEAHLWREIARSTERLHQRRYQLPR